MDAFSTGKEVFFARAAFNKNDSASRGLLAHELSHSLQQGVGGEMGGMQHSAPMGAEQGGLIDWFRNLFKKKPNEPPPRSAPPKPPEPVYYLVEKKTRRKSVRSFFDNRTPLF